MDTGACLPGCPFVPLSLPVPTPAGSPKPRDPLVTRHLGSLPMAAPYSFFLTEARFIQVSGPRRPRASETAGRVFFPGCVRTGPSRCGLNYVDRHSQQEMHLDRSLSRTRVGGNVRVRVRVPIETWARISIKTRELGPTQLTSLISLCRTRSKPTAVALSSSLVTGLGQDTGNESGQREAEGSAESFRPLAERLEGVCRLPLLVRPPARDAGSRGGRERSRAEDGSGEGGRRPGP